MSKELFQYAVSLEKENGTFLASLWHIDTETKAKICLEMVSGPTPLVAVHGIVKLAKTHDAGSPTSPLGVLRYTGDGRAYSEGNYMGFNTKARVETFAAVVMQAMDGLELEKRRAALAAERKAEAKLDALRKEFPAIAAELDANAGTAVGKLNRLRRCAALAGL